MNVLFVNYGNYTTNSLNHIGGFAGILTRQGHACAVAVPGDKDTIKVIADPQFIAVSYAEALAGPNLFPDGRGADIVHAWTPREGVRSFVLAYQKLAPAKLIVHLEDNEEYLVEAFGGVPVEHLRELPDQKFPFPMVDGLPHPVRYRHLLRLADGITHIVESLTEFVPAGIPHQLLPPGVDPIYTPLAPEPKLRAELGLTDRERVITYTGSVTFANAAEMVTLYEAVRTLNQRGIVTRLIRTGHTLPDFQERLGFDPTPFVLDLGFVDKRRLPALLALADVLVQPGVPGKFNDYRLPSKLPEFLASGRPVILPAANVGRQLSDGREAVLLQSGTASEIADACDRIFRSPSLATDLGRAGAVFARHQFDLPTNTHRLIAFYERIVSLPANTVWAELKFSKETDVALQLAQLREQLQTKPSGLDAATTLQWLDDLVRACRQLDFDLQARATTISDLRRHAAGLEQARDVLRHDIASVRAHAAEHARQLEEENRKLHRSVTRVLERTREIGETAEREVVRLQDELYQSEYRVLRMSSSFSWRATAWLRALRRRIIDPRWGHKQPPPPVFPDRLIRISPGDFSLLAPAPSIRSHLDTPRHWPTNARELVIRGWVVAEDTKRTLKGIRAQIGGRTYLGELGQARPDVGLNFKQFAGAGQSGFKIVVSIEESDERVVIEALDDDGLWHVFYTQGLGQHAVAAIGTYSHWVMTHDTRSALTLEMLRRGVERWPAKPVISLLMPVYNTPERWLVQAIDSVLAQAYPHWELCIADDASTEGHVRAILERYSSSDHRIKIAWRQENGHISASSNSALELCSGDFVGLLDHDDELAPHALFCVAQELVAHPDTEVLYSDEDKIDENGTRFDPHFKPDWNPDLLSGQNYLSHLIVYRTSTVRRAGGFRIGFEGAQDWDLALRITEQTAANRIRHLPRVLYHWRAIEGSTAMQLQEKTYASKAAERALAEHFARLDVKVNLKQIVGGHWHARRERPSPAPRVTLIIPTRNRTELLVKCVQSIRAQTNYPNYEILIADNDSDDPKLLDFYNQQKHLGNFEVVDCPGGFNYSAINNRAVAVARGEIVGLLNNDLEAIHPEWLDEMVAEAVRPEIGCVGAKLYYPDMRIQHAGVITGLGGVAGHPFKGFAREEPGTPQFRPHLLQNLSCVTAACLVVRKSVYLEAGGLDDSHLAIAFNDVDFCLKVRALGYRNLYTPFAELLHHESASRGAEDTPEKVKRFQSEITHIKTRWGNTLLHDPAYNPNLSLDSEDWALAYPPRTPPLEGSIAGSC